MSLRDLALPRSTMSEQAVTEIVHYTCYRSPGPIRVDGKLDEVSWANAPWFDAFVDLVTGEPPWFKTRVALLWDERYLYVGFDVQETDVRATHTERDSPVYEENDLEVFIAAKDAYYEFEINAHNTVYEAFWIWKDALGPESVFQAAAEFEPEVQRAMTLAGVGGHLHPRGERWGFLDWDLPGLLHAVHVDGTLNQSDDVDSGWTAELAFPWRGLQWLADGRSLPPRAGDTWRIECSRFQQRGLDGAELARSAGWTWNRHGHYDSHIPELFPYVHFSTDSVLDMK